MLDEGIIPCVNRGAKTHTYLIRMEDVQIYLERSDTGGAKRFRRDTSMQSPQKATECHAWVHQLLRAGEENR